uniref:Uncharacterized protein n=1 Tax=Glycine max TaxID=3847 RepID=C6T610_SOYBN|nr:unknown [Glycine max]
MRAFLSILLSIFMSLKGAMEILRLPFALINQGLFRQMMFASKSLAALFQYLKMKSFPCGYWWTILLLKALLKVEGRL